MAVRKTSTSKKLYMQSDTFYKKKLKTVMEKFGIEKYDYDWGQKGAYVEFIYKGVARRFAQTIENMQAEGIRIYYGSDVFATIVLSLEDLYRMDKRGIYHIDDSMKGIPMLPAATRLPECFITLGFDGYPDMVVLKERWRTLSKAAHPDSGGNDEYFNKIRHAYEQAMEIIRQREGC